MRTQGANWRAIILAACISLVASGCSSDGDDARRAPDPPVLGFYDWEANLVGPDGAPGAGDPPSGAGIRSQYRTVLRASRARPRAEPADRAPGEGRSLEGADRANNSRPAQFYVFDSERELVAGPTPARPADPPPGGEVLKVPAGIVVVSERPPSSAPPGAAPERYFVLEDDAELSNAHIATAEQDFDPRTQEPVVILGFTADGRERFERLTKRVARRGARRSAATGATGRAAFHRFAIVLDHQLVALATIDFVQLPDGVDGRTGAMITDLGSLQTTQEVAEMLDNRE